MKYIIQFNVQFTASLEYQCNSSKYDKKTMTLSSVIVEVILPNIES